MYNTTEILKEAYIKLLELGNWPGRISTEGQELLCKLRGAIAQETDQDIQEVQESAEAEAIRRQYRLPQ
jgi:hypothetical protein